MMSVPRARLALIGSLVLLGVSLTAFATTAGIAGSFSSETTGELSIEDGTVVFVDSTSEATPIAEASAAERIEVADRSGLVVVSTHTNETTTLTESKRETAAQIALRDPRVVEQLQSSDGATVEVSPVRADEPIDEQLRRPEIAVEDFADSAPTFQPVDSSADSVTLQRVGPQYDDRKAIVSIEPIDAPEEYRAVVDFDTEAVDRILQFEVVS